jgi:hypothetical protein
MILEHGVEMTLFMTHYRGGASLDEAEMFGILSVRVSAPHYALFEES